MWGRAAARHRGSHSVRGEAQTHKYCVVKTRKSSGSRTVARWRSGGQLTWLPSTTCVRSELARTVLLSVAVTILERLKNEESRRLEELRGESD